MAGHSKWANIKHKKAANDKKRAKVWTKIIREINVAAREGKTSDPNAHPRLRLAVDKALAANMTKDTIERACKRGAGELEGQDIDEIRYEGYGPGGIAILVDTETDNLKRTVSEVRHAFTRAGGNLGTDGSVSYLFNEIGLFQFPSDTDEEALMDVALEAGAEDVITTEEGIIEVITKPSDYMAIYEALKTAGFETEDSEVTLRAELLTSVDEKTAEKLLRLIDSLEELDDVQEVYSNADISDEILATLANQE